MGFASLIKSLFARRDTRTSLQKVAADEPIGVPVAPLDARALVEELRAVPLEKRVKAALDAGLPKSALKLDAHAGAVLAFILEDEQLRLVIGHAALLAWLEHDRDECIAHALARADCLTPLQLWQLLIELQDASEIYDVFAPIYRGSAANARALLAVPFDDATARRVLGDPRIVDLALEGMSSDVRASCTLLALNASTRAVDELRAVLERVPDQDEQSTLTEEAAGAAVDGLHAALPTERFIDVLATFLDAQPTELMPRMFRSLPITQHALALGAHPLVRNNALLRAAVAQSMWPPRMPVG